jgi:ribosomal protein S18 acetylase RimI-like enzyme
MKKNLTFRKATVEDTDTIVQLGADTFKAAFGPYHTPEDMDEYLAANFNNEIVQSLLEDVSSHFLLGYEGKKVIGYAMLREEPHPDFVSGSNPIELIRFYVTPEVIGLGYGSELMRICLEEALTMGHTTIWLATWQKNERAIRFYERWGFRIVGNATYVIGEDVTDDFIMQWSE